jgi:hypothetical protein
MKVVAYFTSPNARYQLVAAKYGSVTIKWAITVLNKDQDKVMLFSESFNRKTIIKRFIGMYHHSRALARAPLKYG